MKRRIPFTTKPGVGMLFNKENEKMYIFAAANMSRAVSQLKYKIRTNRAPVLLQQDWLKFGEAAFSFEVLEMCDEDMLQIIKEKHLKMYKPFDYNEKGYNTSAAAGNWG